MTNHAKQDHLLNCSAPAEQGPGLLPGGSNPGAYNDDALTRALVADAIQRSGKSRDEIAERMSFLLALKITTDALDKFIAEGKQADGFPLAWMRAFCTVTDDWRLIQHLAEQSGFLLLDCEDADLVSLGELVVQQEKARHEIERHANNIIARRAGV